MHYTRRSDATDFGRSRKSKGIIKLRLAHGRRGSIIIPDMVFARDGGWYYYLPSFFGPPHLAFNVPNELGGASEHTMQFSADFAAPTHISAARVMIGIGSAGLLRQCPDGAQIYECEIIHNGPLRHNASGRCLLIGDEFWISAYHHTTPETAKLIHQSGHFLGSNWNIQGTRRLKNVCYPYFTTLAKIRSDADLERIAMSSHGKIELEGTGVPPARISLEVYREQTTNRTHPIMMWIPAEIISPAHLRLFDPDSLDPSYYEVVNPEIVRIGLKPGSVLRFENSKVVPDPEHLKTFDYVICGNASSSIGLNAPYDEEETTEIVHFERLEHTDLFQFWQDHPNSDQMTGRNPEPRALE